MEDLLLMYFKDKPQFVSAYHRFKPVVINVLLLAALCVGILAKTEGMRSFSLGLAAGITLINIGESVNRLNQKQQDKVQ